MEEIKISNRQIALMAFDRLRKEDKTDSALKLARCMLHGTSISLGIGDIDWEIDRAIQQCGGVPRTGYRYTAYFHFNRNTEMAKEIYDKIVRNCMVRKQHGGGLKAASVIYNGMYGKRNPAVHR